MASVAGAIPKRFGDGMNAAFSLNRFDQNGADGVVELGFEVGDVVEADKLDARQQRREGQAIFFGGRDAHGAERAAVEGIVHRQDAVLWRGTRGEVGGSAAVETREFQRAFDGFRTAVGEKHAVHAGPLRELLRERALKGVVVQIREVNSARGFAADDFDDARMRVAERVDGDAAEEIEIFFAGRRHRRSSRVRESGRMGARL